MDETLTGTLLLVPRLTATTSLSFASSDVTSRIRAVLRSPATISRPLLFSVLLYCVTSYLTNLLHISADVIVVHYQTSHHPLHLPDLLSDNLPILPRAIPTFLAAFFILLGIFRFLLTPIATHVLRRLFFLQSVVLLFRAATVFTTPLSFRTTCTPSAAPFLLRPLLAMLDISPPCTSLLFSPTTTLLIFIPCFATQYLSFLPTCSYTAEVAASWALTIPTILLYACASNDLFYAHLAGALFAILLFLVYHFYLVTIWTRNNYFNAFLRWFEQDAPDIPKLARLANRRQKLNCN